MKEIQKIAEELRNENEKCYKECEGCCCDIEDNVCACKDAVILSALEKQIPKKPVKYGDTRQGLDNDGNSISKQEDCYECPSCDSFLGYVSDCKDENYQDCYCRACGQAIDWSK